MFTKQDIEVIDEALNAWITNESTKSMNMTMLMIMLGGPGQDVKRLTEDQSEKAQKSVDERRERCIPLRAKLLQLRDSAVAEEFLKST